MYERDIYGEITDVRIYNGGISDTGEIDKSVQSRQVIMKGLVRPKDKDRDGEDEIDFNKLSYYPYDIVSRLGFTADTPLIKAKVIEEDGSVFIASTSAEGMAEAKKTIEEIIQEAEMGKVYVGKITKLMDFGAFIEIFPGTEGMCHISEITDKERVNDINKYLKEGQEVRVKVIKIDPDSGKIGLSIKKA